MTKIINTEKLIQFTNKFTITSQFEMYYHSLPIQDTLKYRNMNLKALDELCLKINKDITTKPKKSEDGKSNLWKKGEFKLYIWVVTFYCSNSQLPIQQLNTEDFEYFSEIFVSRDPLRLQFQLYTFFKSTNKHKKKWSQDQIFSLKNIIRKCEQNKKCLQWKQIAYQLYVLSDGSCLKTFSQCREMWTNHLKDDLVKNKWSEHEDNLLQQLVFQYGTKWSKIAEKFEGTRSARMVKNRYNALLKKAPKLEEIDITQTMKEQSLDKEEIQKYQVTELMKQSQYFEDRRVQNQFKQYFSLANPLAENKLFGNLDCQKYELQMDIFEDQ